MTGQRRQRVTLLLASALTAAMTMTGCSGSSPTPQSQGASTASGSAADGSSPTSPSKSAPFNVKQENAKPGTTAWNIGSDDQASDSELAGFVDHDSVLPGTRLNLKATTSAPSFQVTAYRMGWYGGSGGRQVWASGDIAAIDQPDPVVKPGNEVDASNWKTNSTIDTTGWPQGLYLLRMSALIDGHAKAKWIPLVVRSASLAGKLAIVYATPTYQAYNEWGGWSLYSGPIGTRATHVSFDRPYDRSGARLVTAGERQITALAEKDGLDLAYASQLDINANPQLVRGARGLVSGGHDEYWTPAMRNAWESARDNGTNLAFFGANAAYWRIRVEGRTVVGYKAEASQDPVQGEATTAMWRSQPNPRPENSLTGLLYECFPARGPMVITDPNFWMFNGTGVKQGDKFNGLVGVEIDRAYPIAGTPSTLHVAAHTPVTCGPTGPTHADLAYYTTDSKAGVFASGSMSWAVGLLAPNEHYGIDEAASDFSAKTSSNLLRAMADGPLAIKHPAVSNLAQLAPEASTSSGTGGEVGH